MREPRVNRRRFLQSSAGAALSLGLGAGLGGCRTQPEAFIEEGWDAGAVAHLIPSANHQRILIKASFLEAPMGAPRLRIGERVVEGRASDSAGRFFAFDAGGLEAATSYSLRIVDAAGAPLCDPWPLRTLPHPDASPAQLRLLCFTCAGGPELYNPIRGEDAFVPIANRRRLLARALSLEPDLVVANGDHVYWDQRGSAGSLLGGGPIGWWLAGSFDTQAPLLGGHNESVLKRAVGPQIAEVYGTLFRSVPTFFLRDDHDYFENDEATADLRTFPPDPFMRGAADATQRLYYPELLADPALPAAHRNAAGLSQSFGAVRYGKLLEALLYDCRGHLGNPSDPNTRDAFPGFVPQDIENWLTSRTRSSDAQHVVHMPSTPILWSAGKWGEWYPDAVDDRGILGLDKPKPYWAKGWKAQHDRLLSAAAGRADHIPLFVSGDLHSTAIGEIHETGDLSFADNPVVSLLCGTPGTSGPGWPSRFRGQSAKPSRTVNAEQWTEPIEENGFSILDVSKETIRVSLFRWKPSDGEAIIASLQPFEVHSIQRKS